METATGFWDWLQRLLPVIVLLFGVTIAEAVNAALANSIPRGYTLAIILLGVVVLLGLWASYRQQQQLDGAPDDADAAIGSLSRRVFEVNAYDWDQSVVFVWAGEELILKHLSEYELAILVAQKMRMRNSDSVHIERVLKEWVLAGLITWEEVMPEPDQLGLSPVSPAPYNTYRLTAFGERVLARLRG